MQFIPHIPTSYITQHQLQHFAQNQNHYSSNVTYITIRGFTNIDKNISSNKGTTTTLRKYLLTLLDPNTNQPLFEATERWNNNSILFVFKKEHIETAKNYINNMKTTLTEEFTQETINQIISPKIIKEHLNNTTVTTYKSFLMEANPQEQLPGEITIKTNHLPTNKPKPMSYAMALQSNN